MSIAQTLQREPAMPELVWDGKYDRDGRRVAPLRVALPFQTVETVNESAQQRQLSLDRFLVDRGDWTPDFPGGTSESAHGAKMRPAKRSGKTLSLC
jgi:hypothetical protein